jgi:tRNA (guanine37-N1)-methyltransferase
VRARCAVVPRGEGEYARKKLSDAGLLRTDLSIKSDAVSVFLPVLEGPDIGHPEREEDFEQVASKIKSYKDVTDVPEALRELLPTSFDIIGDVAVFKLDDALISYAEKIGAAMIEANRGIASAALDEGVEGEMRVRRLRVVAGRESTKTLHKEYGISIAIDPALAYYSPRLANERWRIAQMVRSGEVVIDMFAGVGPFSILIAKIGEPKKVHAIDINEHAVRMLKENIRINKAERVEAHLGDAREIAPRLGPSDRIIMNLPHTSIDFLDVALGIINKRGTIHLYVILEQESQELIRKSIAHLAVSLGRGISFKKIHEVHTYSPTQSLFCFDLLIG